ncbi:hypothetical protein K503DRAFT_775687 [Rhizopogon vinicolor AM-OR11-026]|uniref:Uncharacterized protein n=1 Tax=Rhizopogon vinicolor AM-OR11-026 TaxID=1314800 RepID=A0A1B7MLA4_9AGAM|nr:hypothetical protein K503DRAFT_775687 [Rhizopogon vinicolor AM-OR11-026]
MHDFQRDLTLHGRVSNHSQCPVTHLTEPAIANLTAVTAEAPVSARLRVKSNSFSFSLYVPHPPPDFWVSEVRLMRRRTPNILGISLLG